MAEVSESVDVAIVGGGLVGASLACALRTSGWRLALIEPHEPVVAAPAWDERSIALNLASRDILRELGLWDAIARDAEPIRSTHISERGRFGVARFTAEEAGDEALGYNVPVRSIGEAALGRARGIDRLLWRVPDAVRALAVDQRAARLSLSSGATLEARLVVAADGTQSPLRRLHGIGARTEDYAQTAVLGTVEFERPHGGVAYERFTPDGPLAVLPRPRGCAVVWTVPGERAEAMLAWDQGRYLSELHAAFGHRLGRPLKAGRRFAYPLARVMAEALTAPRTVFVGNAAQTVHPVAAQGFNLGLRDVASLAQCLNGAEDPGDVPVLARYVECRRDDRQAISDFTDRLVRTFSNRVPGLSALRHLGLLALDLTPPVKRRVMAQNLGRLARPAADLWLP